MKQVEIKSNKPIDKVAAILLEYLGVDFQEKIPGTMWVAESYGGTEFALICKDGEYLLSAEEDPLHELYRNEKKFMGDISKLLDSISKTWEDYENCKSY